MRQISRRKSNKSLIICIHERDLGKLSNSPNWPKPSPLIPQKRMWRVVVWDLKGEEGNLHADGKANVW